MSLIDIIQPTTPGVFNNIMSSNHEGWAQTEERDDAIVLTRKWVSLLQNAADD